MTRSVTNAQQTTLSNEDVTQITAVVQSAIEENDLLPLVRLVLDGQLDAGSPFSTNSVSESISETVKNSLLKVIQDANASASTLSRDNTGSITTALDELETIQKSTGNLAQEYEAINFEIRDAGAAILSRWKDYADLQEMENTLLSAGRNLEWACSLLQRCLEVSENVDQHRLYQALNVLEEIHNQMSNDIACTSETLKGFLQEILNDLRNIIQQLAVSDFNDWLVTARSEARQIGLQAIRQAAINRQHEDRCTEERKTILEQLKNANSIDEIVSMVSSSLGTHSATSESSKRPAFQSMDVISFSETSNQTDDDHIEKSSTLSDRSGNLSLFHSRGGSFSLMEAPVSAKSEMNMRGLHRCVYVHKRLGRMGHFREYYLEQRRLQMDSDLRPPSNFLEVYQAYLSQVTGFFIIEDNVQRMTDGLINQQDVDRFWEMAITMLKSVVDSAFEGMNSASAMLLVKDFLLLVCGGLSRCGYPAANLKEILSSNMGKYHALMNAQGTSQVAKILHNDSMECVKIKTEAQKSDYLKQLGLPYSIDLAKEAPKVPFTASFTEMVPQMINVVHEYVRDSIAYLKGLINHGDILTTACQHRDKMIKVTLDSLHSQLNNMIYGDLSLEKSMQLVTNVWALSLGFNTIEDWTMQYAMGGNQTNPTINRKSSVLATSKVAYQLQMRALEDVCIRLVIHVTSSEINTFMTQMRSWDYVPRISPPSATSPLIEELMIYLNGVHDSGIRRMPKANVESMMKAVMKVVGCGFLDVLCGNSISAINEHGFNRLLEDLNALEKFSDQFNIQGLSLEISKPRKLCSLVLSDQSLSENVDEVLKEAPDVSHRALIAVLEKYREVGGWQAQRVSKRGMKRRDIDILVRKLKEQS
eukprot:g3395.t1